MSNANITIGNFEVGEGFPCFFIAEIGINHNGSMEITKKLIDAAAEAGAQAVKFQKRTVSVVYTEEELARDREVPADMLREAVERGVLPPESVERLQASDFTQTTNGDLKHALEFSKTEYEEIDRYCKEKGLLWCASPWDEESIDFLAAFNPPMYKIASASLTDDGILQKLRATGRPLILSTGMSTMEEMQHAVDVLGTDNLLIMHCVSTYPAELEELNLQTIKTLEGHFSGVPIGYSGHEKGVYSSLCAAVLGATAIERHLTLDRTMWGSDQSASLEPHGFGLMVKEVRNFEKAKGDGVKRLLDAEVPIQKKLRRVVTVAV